MSGSAGENGAEEEDTNSRPGNPLNEPRRRRAAWIVGTIAIFLYWAASLAEASFIALPAIFIGSTLLSLPLMLAAFFVGMLLYGTPLGRFWYANTIPAFAILTLAFAILLFGKSLGLGTTVILPESGDAYEALHPLAGWGACFLAVFGAMYYPSKRDTRSVVL